MSEMPRPEADALNLQALLYAVGELEPLAAAAFEAQLADDQAAREALVKAVQLTQLTDELAGKAPITGPSPAYRSVVRAQLRQPVTLWGRLIGRRRYVGHPLAWTAAGLAAGLMLMLSVGSFRSESTLPSPDVIAAPIAPPGEVEPAVVVNADADDPVEEEVGADRTPAMVWADMHNDDHLQKARAAEQRRRQREAERPGREPTDRRSRILRPTGRGN